MALHNMKLSHMLTAACRICRKQTKALVNGRVERQPVCPSCKVEFDRQFRVASLVRARARG